jgi:hypothetical protein
MKKSTKVKLTIADFRVSKQSQLRDNLMRKYPRIDKFTCYNDSTTYDEVPIITAQVLINRLAPLFCTHKISERVLQFAVDHVETHGIEQYDNCPFLYRDFLINVISAQLHIFCERDFVFIKQNSHLSSLS